MFKRVRDSLVYPKEILKYRKDSIFFVLFYLVFFAILLSTKSTIDVIKYDGLSEEYKTSIIEKMTVVNQDCELVSAKLVCDGNYLIKLYEEPIFTIYLDSSNEIDYSEYPSNEYTIIIHDEDINFYLYGISTLQLPLSDLPASIHNLDFDDQVNNPTVFYDNLFEGIDELVLDYKIIWGSMMVFIEIIISILFYLIFVLVSAWFLKRRYPVIPFKQTFTMITYSSTSLFIILTFYYMLELSLFIIIILLIVSFRQNGIMSREIEKRLKKKS